MFTNNYTSYACATILREAAKKYFFSGTVTKVEHSYLIHRRAQNILTWRGKMLEPARFTVYNLQSLTIMKVKSIHIYLTEREVGRSLLL